MAPGYGVPGFNSRYDNRFSYAGMEGMGKGGGGGCCWGGEEKSNELDDEAVASMERMMRRCRVISVAK